MNNSLMTWNGNRKYTIRSMASNPAGQEIPKPADTFVVDNTAPAITVITPNGNAYLNTLPTLSGTVTDTAPGTIASVVLHVVRDDGNYWNWQQSTFTALSGASDLTASLGSGNLSELYHGLLPGEYRNRRLGEWPDLYRPRSRRR